MRFSLTIGMLLVLPLISAAQITITKADYDAIIAAASYVGYVSTNAEGATIDIGTAGTGQTWDISGFAFDATQGGAVSVDPSTTTYASTFPDATHAFFSSSDNGDILSYVLLNTSGLYLLGIAGEEQGQAMVLTYSPPVPEVLFPAAMNVTWTYDGDPTTMEFTGGKYIFESRSESEIDAAGTLISPAGSHDCLRQRTRSWETTTMEYEGQVISTNVTESVTYTFYTKEGLVATVVADTTSPVSGTITMDALTYIHYGVQTDVEQPAAQPDGLGLRSAYPNPVMEGHASVVRWDLPSAMDISVKVYDVRGAEMATVYEGYSGAGLGSQTFPVSLQPGVYFLRLYTPQGSFAQPLTVIQ